MSAFLSAPFEIVKLNERVIVRRPRRLPTSALVLGVGATVILVGLLAIAVLAVGPANQFMVIGIGTVAVFLGLLGIWAGAIGPYVMDAQEAVRFEADTATGIATFPRSGLCVELERILRVERVRFSQSHSEGAWSSTDTTIVYEDSCGDLRGAFLWRGGRKARSAQLASLLGVPLAERSLGKISARGEHAGHAG